MTNKEKYKEFLQTKEWKKIRKDTLDKYNWKCQICGTKSKHNHVHHIFYDKWENPPPGSLRVLCDIHHNFIHKKIDEMGKSFYYDAIPDAEKWETLLCFIVNNQKKSNSKLEKPTLSKLDKHLISANKNKSKRWRRDNWSY